MDPLNKITRISNPTAVSLFEKDNKRILLLGDAHTQGNECPRCKPPKCVNYITILKELDEYHKKSSTQMDVFLEIFAPDYPQKMTSRLYEYGKWKGNSILRSIIGSQIDLAKVREDLLSKLYFHEKSDVNQRYHYFDFRQTKLFEDYDLSVKKLMIAYFKGKLADYYDDFFTSYPTKKSLVDTLKDFLFGKPFDPSYKHRDLLSHGMTRISKQFHKLSRSEQAVVRSFAVDRINDILQNYRFKDVFDFFDRILNLLTLLTDIYAICRFLRFFSQQNDGSTSVFIAGAAHTYNYTLFLKEWKAKKVFSNQKKVFTDANAIKKCVHVDFDV
jgi:phage FluMu protein Com